MSKTDDVVRPMPSRTAEERVPSLRHGAVTVSLIVPVRNEAANLPHVFATFPEGLHEIVVIDGNSTDGSADVARSLSPLVRVIGQPGRGKGDALRAGFAAATGDVIVMIDADGSMDGREIGRYVEALVHGADLVKGSRQLHGGGSEDFTALRDLGNRVLRAVFNRFWSTGHSELCYGYMGFWRHHLEALNLTCDGFEIETMLNVRAAQAGLAVAEVPSYERHRIHGASNLNVVRDGIRIGKVLLGERFGPAPAR